MDKLKKAEKDEHRHFITLPYPKFYSPETAKDGALKTTDALKAIKNKQTMVFFARFLSNMYKGLDKSTDIPAPSPDDNFSPNMFHYLNSTDVFLKLAEKPYQHDEYFGVTDQFVETVGSFLEHMLTSRAAVVELDDMLKGSFFEFIYKSIMFDVTSKKQFNSFDTMLAHKFLKEKTPINKVKSDTGS